MIFLKAQTSSLVFIMSLISACSFDYGKPPKRAKDAWLPTNTANLSVEEALTQCHFDDRLSVGTEKILTQAHCMTELGFKADLSSYRPDNCYGFSVPAGCWVQWPNGQPQPQLIKPQKIQIK